MDSRLNNLKSEITKSIRDAIGDKRIYEAATTEEFELCLSVEYMGELVFIDIHPEELMTLISDDGIEDSDAVGDFIGSILKEVDSRWCGNVTLLEYMEAYIDEIEDDEDWEDDED